MGRGVKYNCLNSTFKIALKKGLDSEDADRRDSINRLMFSSFCRADEKLYNKHIFSLLNGKTQKSVISKHEHLHAKLYVSISKFCMYAATFGCKICAFWAHVYGSVGCKVCGSWVQVYGEFWVHVYAFWMHLCGFWVHVYCSVGCMYAVVGCMPDCRQLA